MQILYLYHASLRLLNLAGQVTKRAFKNVGEWFANTLAIVSKSLFQLGGIDPKDHEGCLPLVQKWYRERTTAGRDISHE